MHNMDDKFIMLDQMEKKAPKFSEENYFMDPNPKKVKSYPVNSIGAKKARIAQEQAEK